ncbi:MarR family transcriptional regulator [Tsuneonella amylolytica]|uniref:MarR family transcriptional regulator n=1 Tax=Tsuneonella amylolytica TaxID=2338327 RepID=UPI000EA9839D|nr:MarR family transcriptional regulator [Tsuneonella amylolytica]
MNKRSTIDWSQATELRGSEARRSTVQDAAEAELAALHNRRTRMPSSRLSDTEWAILLECFVADGDGKILATKSMEAVAGVSSSTTSRIIDSLEGKGLVTRAGFEGDRRLRLVRITQEGRSAVRTVYRGGSEALQ